MAVEQMATIGKVINTQGVVGGLKVFPYSDFPERVKELSRVFLHKDQEMKAYSVDKAFVHGRFWVLHLKGVSGISEAEACVGALLQIPLSERRKLPEHTYYLDQIIGLKVYTVEGRFLGEVADIIQTGGNDVYVVRTESDGGVQEVLIPALKKVVINIDMQAGRIDVDLPEGLL
jgi:16S rRNA processing protein RimM